MSEENLVCAVCRTNSSLRCGRCRRIAYCSKEHQKLDWREHKKSCVPGASSACFKVATDEKVGRHLVATRPISECEIVFEEAPLVTGPSGGTLVCLGCYKLLNRINIRNCSRCNWPVCSRDCENSEAHKPECEMTTKFGKEKVNITNFESQYPSYRYIIVLRGLYLKSTDRAAWEKVDALESHMEQRRNSERYDDDMRLVVQFILRYFNFHEFSGEDFLRMAAIVDVNAYFVPRGESCFSAIYDKGSMIEHNCLPNCSKSFTEDGKIVIRAAREIQEGDHLSISYTEVLWGTQARQDHLFRTKYFVCECDRCSDPTELGTYFDSFKCPVQGCCGYVVRIKSGPPMKYHWQCEECRGFCSGGDFADLTAAVNERISNLKGNPESCREFLMKYRKYLHPNHYSIVRAELELLKNSDPFLLCLKSNNDLNVLMGTARRVINLTEKLAPAEMGSRGHLILISYYVSTELCRRKILSGEVDRGQLKQHILMCRGLLEKAHSLLKIEPQYSKAAELAKEALKDVQSQIEIIRA